MMKTSYRKLKRWIAISGLLLMLPCLVNAQTITYEWYRGSTKVGSGATFTENSTLSAGTYTYYRKAIYNGKSLQTTPFTVTVKRCTISAGGNDWSQSDICTSCTWQEAKDKCASLGMRLPDNNDWGRLPKNSNVLGLTGENYYWSATEDGSDGGYGWGWSASSSTLRMDWSDKTFLFRVRCVYDWAATDACTSCTWQEAKDKCASLGMRLPNDSDWGTLPKNSNVLGLADNLDYWSATESNSDSANGWYWYAYDGGLYSKWRDKTKQVRGRCVRN